MKIKYNLKVFIKPKDKVIFNLDYYKKWCNDFGSDRYDLRDCLSLDKIYIVNRIEPHKLSNSPSMNSIEVLLSSEQNDRSYWYSIEAFIKI